MYPCVMYAFTYSMYAEGDVGAENKRYRETKRYIYTYSCTISSLDSALLLDILSPSRFPLTPFVKVTKDSQEEETSQPQPPQRENE